MSGEKTGANMAITTTEPASSITDPTTEVSPPDDLTPFPDLNLQVATLLARLKNPSFLTTEELISATEAASAAVSAWEIELLTINNATPKKRERRQHKSVVSHEEGMRQKRKPNSMSRREEKKKNVWEEEDWNGDGEEEYFLFSAKQETAAATKNTSQAPSTTDLETPPNESITGSSTSSSIIAVEERQKWKAKADWAAKHSAKMREVWAKRRAEGTTGWKKNRQPAAEED